MTDSRIGAGNIQDEPGVPCSIKKEGSAKKIVGVLSKRHKSQLKILSMATTI